MARAAAALLLRAAAAAAAGQCGTVGDGGEVLQLTDGKNDRCVSVITPSGAHTPMPVLFWFHGGGGNAAQCGGDELGQLARERGFALVCPEALQNYYGGGGQWAVPEVATADGGTVCDGALLCDDYSLCDVPYMNNVIAQLAKTGKYDTTRLFTSGCSMGSAMSGYISQCLKQQAPGSISAFATHSTGLKLKGDGLAMPPDNYNTSCMWGECPTCQYWPFAPVKYTDSLGLKACIFDNTGDQGSPMPGGDFYNTSLALVRAWEALGMREAHTFLSGGHCEIHSFAAIVDCLDDGTGRLLNSSAPVPPPAPPGPAPGPDAPPAACAQCVIAACPNGGREAPATCKACVVAHQATCEAACAPYPYTQAPAFFCPGA